MPHPKVIHVIEPGAVGGAESVTRSLALGGRQQGGRPEVAALMQSEVGLPFVELLRSDGVPISEVRCGRRRYLAEVRSLARILGRAEAEIVHTHVYHADFVGYLAAQRCGLPVVATVHGFTGGDLKNRLYQWLDLRLLRRFDAVMCVSAKVLRRVVRSGCPAARVHLVPNGYVDMRPLSRREARDALGLGSEEVVVGWVGRISTEKGPDLLLDAVARLEGPRPVTVLIGDGPERDRVARLTTKSRHPDDAVRLVGERPDAARLLAAFDVLVISSRTEGLPMVLLETMAARVPVVAFSVGGIPDVLDDESGWLVPPGDVEGLTRAIQAVLTSPSDVERRTAAARCILQDRFSVSDWLRRIEAVYSQVLKP